MEYLKTFIINISLFIYFGINHTYGQSMIINITGQTTGHTDEIAIWSVPGASTGTDNYDALKLKSLVENMPYLASQIDGDDFVFYSTPTTYMTTLFKVPLIIGTGISEEFKLSVNFNRPYPDSVCILLHNKTTDENVFLTSSTFVTLNLTAFDTLTNFEIWLGKPQLTIASKQIDCERFISLNSDINPPQKIIWNTEEQQSMVFEAPENYSEGYIQYNEYCFSSIKSVFTPAKTPFKPYTKVTVEPTCEEKGVLRIKTEEMLNQLIWDETGEQTTTITITEGGVYHFSYLENEGCVRKDSFQVFMEREDVFIQKEQTNDVLEFTTNQSLENYQWFVNDQLMGETWNLEVPYKDMEAFISIDLIGDIGYCNYQLHDTIYNATAGLNDHLLVKEYFEINNQEIKLLNNDLIHQFQVSNLKGQILAHKDQLNSLLLNKSTIYIVTVKLNNGSVLSEKIMI